MEHKTIEKYIDWFIANKDSLNISEVSRNSGVPRETLQYFVIGERGLPEKWKALLAKWVAAFVQL